MAARKKALFLSSEWREKIQAGMLLRLLEDNAAGKIKMNAGRIRSAEILLRKVMPDLASMEHKGEMTENVRYVAEMPVKDATTADWLAANSKPSPQNSTKPVEYPAKPVVEQSVNNSTIVGQSVKRIGQSGPTGTDTAH